MIKASLFFTGLLLATSTTLAGPLITGDLLVVDSDFGFGQGKIVQIDPTTGVQTLWASGGFLDQPTDAHFDSQGNLIVSDAPLSGGGEIIRINRNTGQQTLVSGSANGNNLDSTVSLAIESSGNIVALNQDAPFSNLPTVVRVDPVTGAQSLLSASQLNSPLTQGAKIITDSQGNFLITNFQSSTGINGIVKVDPATGAQSELFTGGNFAGARTPGGELIEPANPQELLVTFNSFANHALSGLVEIDMTTGNQRLVSSGGNLLIPGPIAQDSAGTTYIGTRSSAASPTGFIYKVDLTTGLQTFVASGNFLVSPAQILIISDVPEPASLALLGAGTLLLLRKRKPRECA